MLLFPDMTREQHEAQEFCYAAPCTLDEWRSLKAQVKDDANKNYLPYVMKEDTDEEICLILRCESATDDECVTTAAYIRFVLKFTGMVYALPFTCAKQSNSMADIIARTAGVPTHQVRHIEV